MELSRSIATCRSCCSIFVVVPVHFDWSHIAAAIACRVIAAERVSVLCVVANNERVGVLSVHCLVANDTGYVA